MRRHCAIFLLLCAGCSRSFYRQQADAEVYPILQERILAPEFAVGRTRVEAAPQSRLADPYNPDRTPKPPDDPAAAYFMAHPYKFRGSKRWGRFGEADAIEPAGWETALGLEPNGTLRLNDQKAAEIALLNSREYQTAVETLYLTALALTLNRFEFDLQWFARAGATASHLRGVGPRGETNTLALNGDRGVTRNLAAGGQLLVDFANSFVWEFTGNSTTVSSNFGATLIQPLLRNFGRDVRLENLTQGERETLYAVRDFARFRKQFWAGVVVQQGGYLSLLLQVQAVRNARANLRAQENNYELVQEQYRGGRRAVVDVDQALQGLLAARQQILDTEIGLQNSLDEFKRTLGLPPRLPVELDDQPLEQFIVTSPELEKLQEDLTAFDKARKQEFANPPEADALKGRFDDLLLVVQRAEKAIPGMEADLQAWKRVLDQPPVAGDDTEARDRAKQTFKESSATPDEARRGLAGLAEWIERHKTKTTAANRGDSWTALIEDTKKLVGIVDDLVVAQNLSRIYRLDLPPVESDEAAAMAFAKEHRLDLQNQTARVTDAWRKVIVAANSLQSDLNITASANLPTTADANTPFQLNGSNARYTVGLQFDGPLNRQAERNAYRIAQISYQQSRRAYMALADSIEQDIRLSLRSLRQTRVSFEIARQQLIAAARQVANERLLLNAPANLQQRGQGGDATLRTLQALSQLNAARNSLAATFIRYEQQRVQLLLNLEKMQLDDRGFPINVAPPRSDGPASRAGPPPTGAAAALAVPGISRVGHLADFAADR